MNIYNSDIDLDIIRNIEKQLKTVAHKFGINTSFWCKFNSYETVREIDVE